MDHALFKEKPVHVKPLLLRCVLLNHLAPSILLHNSLDQGLETCHTQKIQLPMTPVSKNIKKEKIIIKFLCLTNMNHESDKTFLLAEEMTSEES